MPYISNFLSSRGYTPKYISYRKKYKKRPDRVIRRFFNRKGTGVKPWKSYKLKKAMKGPFRR